MDVPPMPVPYDPNNRLIRYQGADKMATKRMLRLAGKGLAWILDAMVDGLAPAPLFRIR